MTRDPRGFTVIELMVTIAVLGILAALAFPGMRDYMDRQRLISQVRAISNVTQLARSEAIKRSATGAAVAADRNRVSMTVSPGSSWFVGLSNTGAACAGATCVINEASGDVSHTVTASECSGCTMVAPAAVSVITFDLRGVVTAGANQAVTLQSPLGKQLSLTVGRLGRISLCSPGGSLTGYTAC